MKTLAHFKLLVIMYIYLLAASIIRKEMTHNGHIMANNGMGEFKLHIYIKSKVAVCRNIKPVLVTLI